MTGHQVNALKRKYEKLVREYDVEAREGTHSKRVFDAMERAGAAYHAAQDEYFYQKSLRRNPCRKNPTKAQKRLNASMRSKRKRMATALRKYLQQQNPGTKLAGAKVQKLKGGVLKITPIKAQRAGKR